MPAVVREIVHQRHVDHQMGCTCKFDVLNLQVALLSSSARGDGAGVVKSPRLKNLSSADKFVLMCVLIFDFFFVAFYVGFIGKSRRRTEVNDRTS